MYLSVKSGALKWLFVSTISTNHKRKKKQQIVSYNFRVGVWVLEVNKLRSATLNRVWEAGGCDPPVSPPHFISVPPKYSVLPPPISWQKMNCVAECVSYWKREWDLDRDIVCESNIRICLWSLALSNCLFVGKVHSWVIEQSLFRLFMFTWQNQKLSLQKNWAFIWCRSEKLTFDK